MTVIHYYNLGNFLLTYLVSLVEFNCHSLTILIDYYQGMPMSRKKIWSDYTQVEIDTMRNAVVKADSNTPFTSEYAAAYLGKSPHTLQHMRCHQSNAITYSKIGRHVLYRKKYLDKYIDDCEKSCTSSRNFKN